MEGEARRRVIAYLDAQLTADLAVASWTPMALWGLVLALAGTDALTVGLLAAVAAVNGLLTVPVLAVLRRRRALLAANVSVQTIADLIARRRGRARNVFARNRALVARFETCVTTPLLFLALGAGLVRAVLIQNIFTLAMSASLLRAAAFLYTGPSRRALSPPPEIGG